MQHVQTDGRLSADKSRKRCRHNNPNTVKRSYRIVALDRLGTSTTDGLVLPRRLPPDQVALSCRALSTFKSETLKGTSKPVCEASCILPSTSNPHNRRLYLIEQTSQTGCGHRCLWKPYTPNAPAKYPKLEPTIWYVVC